MDLLRQLCLLIQLRVYVLRGEKAILGLLHQFATCYRLDTLCEMYSRVCACRAGYPLGFAPLSIHCIIPFYIRDISTSVLISSNAVLHCHFFVFGSQVGKSDMAVCNYLPF